MKLFQFAVILHPSKDEKEKGLSASVVVPVTTVLANDQNQATMLAGRAIPEEHTSHLDRLEVAVRPF